MTIKHKLAKYLKPVPLVPELEAGQIITRGICRYEIAKIISAYEYEAKFIGFVEGKEVKEEDNGTYS